MNGATTEIQLMRYVSHWQLDDGALIFNPTDKCYSSSFVLITKSFSEYYAVYRFGRTDTVSVDFVYSSTHIAHWPNQSEITTTCLSQLVMSNTIAAIWQQSLAFSFQPAGISVIQLICHYAMEIHIFIQELISILFDYKFLILEISPSNAIINNK